MKASSIHPVIWALIYGGLLALCLSLFVSRRNDFLGTAIAIAGGVAAALGAVLIYVRSRLKDPG
jgi:hypothetical protein